MPYTPPLGNAVNYNFTTTYVGTGGRPFGNSIIFNFGGVIGPISTDVNLPTGMRLARIEEDEWYGPPPRRFFPAGPGVPSGGSQQLSTALYQLTRGEGEEWYGPPPRRFTPIYPAGVLPYSRVFTTALYQQVRDEPEPFMFRRSPIVYVPAPLTKRAVLFVVT